MAFRVLSPLHRATRQITLALEEVVGELGLRADEGHALSYLASYSPCPTGDLQRVLGAPRSTLTSMVDRLCERELVERVADPDDGRVLRLQITRQGRALARRVEAAGHELEQRITTALSERDLHAFDRMMTAINDATGVTVVERKMRKG